MQILRGLGRWPERLAFSPDGRLLAAGDDHLFHVWDAAAGPDPLWSASGSYLEQNFAFTPDGGHVVGGQYGHFARYRARTGDGAAEPLGPAFYTSLFAPGGRFVVAAAGEHTAGGAFRLRCARPAPRGGWEEAWVRERAFNFRYGWNGYRALLFTADGSRLVRVSELGPTRGNAMRTEVETFDLAAGDTLGKWTGELPSFLRQGAVGPTGAVVLLHCRALYALDTTAPDAGPVKRLNATPKHFTSAAFSPDGTRLVTASNDTAATVWDATTWEVRKRYEWKLGRLRTVCFAPDGLRCAAGGDAGQVVVWDLDD